ncbi:MAG: rRNA maturation RNase YbeY [Bdellovibrionales bacterium]
MKLLLVNQSRDRVQKAWLEKWVKGLSRVLARHGFKGLARRELVVVFVTSGEIRRLNRLYRRKDYSTDVLSFAPAEPSSVGELVLCLPIIRKQSVRTGLGERGELGYMIVHGVLHLLGYDHMKKSDEAEMFALQDLLYTELSKKMQ